MDTQALASNRFFDLPPQRFLVTGGTGFIGRQLVDALLAAGHEVMVLTRRPAIVRAAQPGLRLLATLDDLAAHAAVGVVINLAGAPILGWPWTAARRQVLLDSRIGVTRRLVDWMAGARHRPRMLISASAIGYYGVQPLGQDALLLEDSPAKPVFMSMLCQAWEREAATAAQHGVTVACLRLGLVLGHGGALPMLLLPVRMGLGGRLGSGKQWMSWVHVEDVLGAMDHVLRRTGQAACGAWNVTAPQQLQQMAFSRTVAAVLRRPCVFPTPGWPVRLALGEQSDLLLQGQRVHPGRLLAQGFGFRRPTLDAALAHLCGRPAVT